MGFRRYHFKIVTFFLPLFLFSQWGEPINYEAVNSINDELAPFFDENRDLLYFSSVNANESLIYSYKEVIKELSGNVNKTSRNNLYFSLIDSTTAIFSSFIKHKNQSYLNLFYSNLFKNNWSEGKVINELSSPHYISQATVSKSGDFMVFASNKESNSEDTDLFISFKLADGRWDKAKLIENLSTNGEEITPFLKGNDSLFFASNGQGGKGGFEIFLSIKEMGIWQRPQPLNRINSTYDESDPHLTDDGVFYFSSDRPGGFGGFDIYRSEKESIQIEDSKPEYQNIELECFVSDIKVNSNSSKFIESINPFFLFEKAGNNLSPNNELLDFIQNGGDFNSIKLIAWISSDIEEGEATKNSKVLADKRLKIIKDLILKTGFKSEDILIKYETLGTDSESQNYILCLIDDLLPVRINSKINHKILPQILKFQFQSEKQVSKDISFFADETQLFNQNILTNSSLTFDLKKFRDKIAKSDSLVIKLQNENPKSFVFFVNKTQNQEITNELKIDIPNYQSIGNDYFIKVLEKTVSSFTTKNNLRISYKKSLPDTIKAKLIRFSSKKITFEQDDSINDNVLVVRWS